MLARGNTKRHADLAFSFSSIYTAPFESAPVVMSKLLEIAVTGSGHPGHWFAQIRAGACSAGGETSPPLEPISRAAAGSAQYKIASRFLEARIPLPAKKLLSQKSYNTVVRLLDISAPCRLVLQLTVSRVGSDSDDACQRWSPPRLLVLPAMRATPCANA